MSTVAALLAAIRRDRDDRLPRLVLADWFEERGHEADAACLRADKLRHGDPLDLLSRTGGASRSPTSGGPRARPGVRRAGAREPDRPRAAPAGHGARPDAAVAGPLVLGRHRRGRHRTGVGARVPGPEGAGPGRGATRAGDVGRTGPVPVLLPRHLPRWRGRPAAQPDRVLLCQECTADLLAPASPTIRPDDPAAGPGRERDGPPRAEPATWWGGFQVTQLQKRRRAGE